MAEGAVVLALVLALAGCAGQRERVARKWGQLQWVDGAHKTVPDSFDYLRSVQCAALSTLQGDLSDGLYPKGSGYQRWELFLSWAAIRAREAGQDARQAKADIDDLADSLREQLGEGDARGKLKRLATEHEGDLKVCYSAVDDLLAEIVMI